jgi:glycosyltransferase involved in cell wall biosynthesis
VSKLDLITAIPLNVRQGSGCYVGIRTLAAGLRRLGADVKMITPSVAAPFYWAERVLFNESLRWRKFSAGATIGIDADGYSVAARRKSPPHVACIKGVLGDAVGFETGATRASMAFQARLEAKHARRADLVITVSRYCAQRLEELYGVANAAVVPELIDLESWRQLFRTHPAERADAKFTVLSVCRFYPRKRLDVLLSAAARLGDVIPGLEIRIVGNGPEWPRLEAMCRDLNLARMVRWLGDLSIEALAEEYNRADVFCLPSVQEGFGIVFLEAMAASKPIVAVRAAAVPEVVRSGVVVEPENADALAEGIAGLYRDPDLRQKLGLAGSVEVENFEMNRVARIFLTEMAKVAPELAPEARMSSELRSPQDAAAASTGHNAPLRRSVARVLEI